MFNPKTPRLEKLSNKFPKIITQLENIFLKNTNIYIDYANVIHWHNQLGWHVDIKRLKQLLDSFENIKKINFYTGTLKNEENILEADGIEGDVQMPIVDLAKKCQYTVCTKPVKIMNLSIDVSSIPDNSPIVLQNFIDKQLLIQLNLETVTFVNNYLKKLNSQGVKFIEKRKCNFDVEIGIDVLLDHKINNVDTFILWSGDSDFAGPLEQLINDGKKVVIFSTARRISHELKSLRDKGAYIFDIQKIKEFICFAREMQKGSR